MPRFEHLIFVCKNRRDENDPRGSCAARGGEKFLERLKELTSKHGLKGKTRITGSGCLDYCAKGCAAVAFSPNIEESEIWYTHLGPDDADKLFQSHVLENRPLDAHLEKSARVLEKSSKKLV